MFVWHAVLITFLLLLREWDPPPHLSELGLFAGPVIDQDENPTGIFVHYW